LYRKRIVELLALYELEPDLKQFWVEGRSDVSIFNWYFSVQELRGVRIDAIDNIEIPPDVLERYGLTSSNRNRVIALALEMEEGLRQVDNHSSLRFVVDRDFDDFMGRRIEGKFLEYTDFTSIELYFFNFESISKVIKLATNTPDRPVDELMSRIATVGSELFFIRTANEILSWNLKISDPVKLLSCNLTSIDFDVDQFISRTMMENSKSRSEEEFRSLIDEIRRNQPDDPRLKIRGHDFIHLFHWAIRDSIRPKNSAKYKETIAQFLVIGSDVKILAQFEMFSNIEKTFR